MSTLERALQTAVEQGLIGLTLWRTGSKPMWQASSQWRGRDGFAVHIEATPAEAVTAALGAFLPASASVSSAPSAPSTDDLDIFA